MTAQWPKDEVATADEFATLTAFLGHQREFLIRKTSGLNEEQIRTAACPPSDLTLLGLVRHASEVERHWAKKSFAGSDIGFIYCGSAHPEGDKDGDFHPPFGSSCTSSRNTHVTSDTPTSSAKRLTVRKGSSDSAI